MARLHRLRRPGVIGAPACVEDCTDGIDNDGNGYTDCNDRSCAFNHDLRACEGGSGPHADGIDNDGTGRADCMDWGCWWTVVCGGTGTAEHTDALCSDGIDNDGAGYPDCADWTCTTPRA